jgi:hypothetical protein
VWAVNIRPRLVPRQPPAQAVHRARPRTPLMRGRATPERFASGSLIRPRTGGVHGPQGGRDCACACEHGAYDHSQGRSLSTMRVALVAVSVDAGCGRSAHPGTWVALVAGERHRDDRTVDRSLVCDRRRQHAGGAVHAARRDPAVGVAGDHACGPLRHDGRARPRCTAAVHANGPRPVLQRRAGPDPRGRPAADAGRRLRRDRTHRAAHPRVRTRIAT